MGGDFLQPNRITGERRDQRVRPLQGAVSDDQPTDAMVVQMAGDQFDGVASPDQQCGALRQIGENLLGQANRSERDRTRTGPIRVSVRTCFCLLYTSRCV